MLTRLCCGGVLRAQKTLSTNQIPPLAVFVWSQTRSLSSKSLPGQGGNEWEVTPPLQKDTEFVTIRPPDLAEEDERVSPIVFVSGLIHHPKSWDKYFAPYFNRKGFECQGVALRATIQQSVDQLAEVAHHHIYPPIIVAHSLGCYVTYKYLESFPCSAAVFLNPFPPLHSSVDQVLQRMKAVDGSLLNAIEQSGSFAPVLTNVDALKRIMFEQGMTMDRLEHFLEKGYLTPHSLSLLNDIKNHSEPRIEKDHGIPMMVLGGLHDDLCRLDDVKLVGEYLGLDPEYDDMCIQWNQHVAHSTVLSPQGLWSADMILEFLDRHGK